MLDFIQVDRVAFRLPFWPHEIYWYGILITLGIAIGAWWAAREIERRKQNVDELYNGLIIVVVAGYLFARLTYVLLDVITGNGARYTSIIDVLNIRAGGVNILGGFVGAALVAALYIRWRRLNFWHYADVAGPALLIAQAIGRWGNFTNQELYGQPTTLPWGIRIDPIYRLPQYSDLTLYPESTRFHPTFLYESLALFLGFILLVWLNGRYRDKWKPGTLFALFLIWWGANRAWIELFRPDQPAIGDSFVTYSMLAAIALAISGVLLLLARYNKLPETGKARRRRRRALKPKPRREPKEGGV
jgi:phosphatidylglycerol:prolipoprotein diacylglycerol transferase